MRTYPRTDSYLDTPCRTPDEDAHRLYKISTDLEHDLQDAETENQALKAKLTAITLWLEKNQPDVWKRGIWDSIGNLSTMYHEMKALRYASLEMLGAMQEIMEQTDGYVPDTSKSTWSRAHRTIKSAKETLTKYGYIVQP